MYTYIALWRVGGYKKRPIVNGLTILTKNTFLGSNISFNGFRIYGGGRVVIGDNFHSGAGCRIITQVHNYNGTKLPYDESYRLKKINIEANVWFGLDVLVLANCIIGEGAIIQAGSVVVSDIPALSIAGGNPARVFSTRDEKHYLKLRNAGEFH